MHQIRRHRILIKFSWKNPGGDLSEQQFAKAENGFEQAAEQCNLRSFWRYALAETLSRSLEEGLH